MKDFLPLIIAIITVGITAYVALINIRRNNIMNARINWLNELKKHISDYCSSIFLFIENVRVTEHEEQNKKKEFSSIPSPPSVIPITEDVQEVSFNPEMKEQYFKINENASEVRKHYYLILLNLNTKEPLHNLLKEVIETDIRKVTDISKKYQDRRNANPTQVDTLNTDITSLTNETEVLLFQIISLSNSILKLEWEIAKSGRFTEKSKMQIENYKNHQFLIHQNQIINARK